MNKQAITAIDKVIGTFFAAFDNRDGKTPNFDDFYDLFIIDCAMIFKREGDTLNPMGLDEFVSPREVMLTDGTLLNFYEWETEQQTLVHGGIATRICRYEKSGLLNGQPYSGQGDKHIQLVLTPQGWKIATVMWQDS